MDSLELMIMMLNQIKRRFDPGRIPTFKVTVPRNKDLNETNIKLRTRYSHNILYQTRSIQNEICYEHSSVHTVQIYSMRF